MSAWFIPLANDGIHSWARDDGGFIFARIGIERRYMPTAVEVAGEFHI